jgi:hypothetical protein
MDSQGWQLYRLCELLVHYYQPFGLAVLRPPYKFALLQPLYILQAAMVFYDLDPEKHGASEACFVLPIKFLCDWFKSLLLHGGSPQQFKIMLDENASVVNSILTPLVTLLASLDGPNWADMRTGYETLISLANGSLELPRRTGPGPSRNGTWQRTPEDALLAMRAAQRGGCGNINCENRQKAVSTSLCSKCGVVRFCNAKVGVSSSDVFTFLNLPPSVSVPLGKLRLFPTKRSACRFVVCESK